MKLIKNYICISILFIGSQLFAEEKKTEKFDVVEIPQDSLIDNSSSKKDLSVNADKKINLNDIQSNGIDEKSTSLESQEEENLDDVNPFDSEETLSDGSGDQSASEPEDEVLNPKIEKITIIGNVYVTTDAILNKVPFLVGEDFEIQKTDKIIKNLFGTGYFKQVQIALRELGKKGLELIILVDEKEQVSEVKFEGNKAVGADELKKKIDVSKIPAVDNLELKKYAQMIKEIYIKRDYHLTNVTPELRKENGKTVAVFKIEEGTKSLVKRIFFKGNKTFTEKELRKKLFTREDWLFGFIDKGGSYQPDMIEGDRHVIETFYQSNGFMTAKIADVNVVMDPKTQQYNITYVVSEGERYKISSVSVPGNNVFPEQFLMNFVKVRAGQYYSREAIRESIEELKKLWGAHGYIYADIDPSIEPDPETKTVDIVFNSELGDKVFLNRINIVGNEKTRDKVIRRQLILEEGSLITSQLMDVSKSRVEGLGYFNQRDGVNWKTVRVDDKIADLDLIVKEQKSGKLGAEIGFGGVPDEPGKGKTSSKASPIDGVKAKAFCSDSNWLGLGLDVKGSVEWARHEYGAFFNLLDPYLFDKPITGGIELFARHVDYMDMKKIQGGEVKEWTVGGYGTLGYMLRMWGGTNLIGRAGMESIKYNPKPRVKLDREDWPYAPLYERIIYKNYQAGEYVSFLGIMSQDFRNHPMHPSTGYRWEFVSKLGIPSLGSKFGFLKVEADVAWYTPLIGSYDLILCLHAHGGSIWQMHNKNIPFKELFHTGGPSNIRGFLFGEIGPTLLGDSIGAKKQFYWNAQLIFPIMPDFSMKGYVFYDGGAGWDAIDSREITDYLAFHNLNKHVFRNDHFDYRHTVGVGMKVTRPQPFEISWGYKIDRRKKLGETPSEVHFSMYREF
ncbi:MAG: Outer membrane protein assembly factor BamA [candidate division TM6 bacterium GW2011_GWF2_32_72]|nr:MAG: Outer membrane protein assembly factor BamA [candidate division TM6 bacterium GW2011_GWF2_32_72]